VIRATVQTVARARHLPHGDHGRVRAAGPVTLMRITPSTTGQAAHASYPRDAGSLVRTRGGGLALAHPQPVVARALSLLGVDQAIEIRDGMSAGADPDR
jgi:hypothetical protein